MPEIVNQAVTENWTVYMITTRKNKLYTGITTDLSRRMSQHKSGQGAKYFRTDEPIAVVWTESGHTRSSASKREYEIKRLTRAQKLKLIQASKLTPQPV